MSGPCQLQYEKLKLWRRSITAVPIQIHETHRLFLVTHVALQPKSLILQKRERTSEVQCHALDLCHPHNTPPMP